MSASPSRLDALLRGAVVFTALAVAGSVVIFLLEQRRVAPALPILFPVPDFALTNQDGRTVTLADLRGQVWLADIIFTRCAGPCPVMTRTLSEIQAAIPSDLAVRFVTLTTDPEYDTPPVLEQYSRRFGAQPGRWHFLTGTKAQIARLAIDGLKLAAVEKSADQRENPNDLFIHSTLFILVDQHGRVRATFESDQPNAKASVLNAIRALASGR